MGNAVVLANKDNAQTPLIGGLEQAAQYDNSDFRVFGKPSSRPYRRMAVALAFGNKPVEDLVDKAKIIANHIKID